MVGAVDVQLRRASARVAVFSDAGKRTERSVSHGPHSDHPCLVLLACGENTATTLTKWGGRYLWQVNGYVLALCGKLIKADECALRFLDGASLVHACRPKRPWKCISLHV